MTHVMKQIRIEKITLNVGVGKDQNKLEKALKLIMHITGTSPVKTFAKKRIPTWGLRPGLPIGCKLTLRGKRAVELLPRLLESKEKKLLPTQFDEHGNVAFGIPEYIDIAGVKYEPDIGILGLEVCVTLARPGFRIKRRKVKSTKIPRSHCITRQEAIEYMKSNFAVSVGVED